MAKVSIERAELEILKLRSDIVRALDRGEAKSASTGVGMAKDFSSGNTSKAELEKRRPFAKRHGSPLDPPEVINEHSGVFKRQWRLKTTTSLFRHAPVIINDTSYADALRDGTPNAFARPIAQTVEGLLTPVRLENIKTELRKLEN